MAKAPQYSGRNVLVFDHNTRTSNFNSGRSVEIIAIFQACSTAKMYAVRTSKLFAFATICTATLNSSESGRI